MITKDTEELVSWAENLMVSSPRVDGYTLVRNIRGLAVYIRSLEKDLADACYIMAKLVKEVEK